MFDTTLSVIAVEVIAFDGDEENVEAAALVFVTGMALPMAGPDGRQLIVPTGQYKVPMQSQAVDDAIEKLQAIREKMPDPKPQSSLVIPGSMQDAERVAQEMDRFGGR